MSGVRWIVGSFSGSCLLWMGCAKLVGITETEVTRDETLEVRCKPHVQLILSAAYLRQQAAYFQPATWEPPNA